MVWSGLKFFKTAALCGYDPYRWSHIRLEGPMLRCGLKTGLKFFRYLSVVEHSLSYYTNKDHVKKLYENMLVNWDIYLYLIKTFASV